MPDPRLKTYAPQAVRHLAQAGAVLALRQVAAGPARGNVPPFPRADDADFHSTLSAAWIWARHQRLSGETRFETNRAAAWAFVESHARRFIPDAIDSAASDEAAYDCALVLLGHAAERAVPSDEPRRPALQGLVDRAARVLSAYLAELDDLGGREFRDPGFLAMSLIDHARASEDRGLLAIGRKFVERAFGMKAPPPIASEPAAGGGLFDFSATTATRILAVMASEGSTPFVGAWLRERVAASAPVRFVPRRSDENTWNACAAWALGRAYVVSTDPQFMQAYNEIMDELERRDGDRDGGLGRDRSFREPETLPTFYYALAVDALVTPESAAAIGVPEPRPAPGPLGNRIDER
jgi:hypothetical protein